MSIEDELGAALRHEAQASPTGAGLDARAAIAGSRARRRPRVAVATTASALAVVGVLAIATPVVIGSVGVASSSSEVSSLGEADGAPASGDRIPSTDGGVAGISRAPAERIAMCESTLPTATASTSGLVLELELPGEVVAGGEATGVARLTNPTDATITGWTTSVVPTFLAVDDIVAWARPGSAGALDTRVVLDPGASVELPVSIVAARCTVDDDLVALQTGAYPPLAALPVGDAVVVAAIDVQLDASADAAAGGASGAIDLVVSAPVSVTITG